MANERLQIIIDATFTGKKSIEQAGRELKALDEKARKASEGTRYLVDKMKSFASVAGAAAAGAALAWKTIGQGAELELARSRFENLAASIGTTADALENQLGQASRGMTTNAEDIASASQIISLGLADNQQDVVDLATLVSQLGWDMNQVILTFANNSKMRLDALGLSVTDVEDRMAELEAQGYDTDKAFDLAVIQAGQAKLELLGGAADTTAGGMERLKNRIIDAKNGLLEFIAVRSGPALEGLANYMDAVDVAQQDMNEAVRKGIITQEEANTIVSLAARGHDQWQERLREVRGELDKQNDTLEDVTRTANAYYVGMGQLAEAERAHAMTIAEVNYHQEEAYEGMVKNTMTLDDYRAKAAMVQEQLRLTAKEQRELATALGDYFTSAVNDGADALVYYNRTVTTTGGLTGEQKDNLEELTTAYERTQANIRSLQGGTAGLGLTEEELNKKLEEQYNQLGLIQSAMGPLQGITADVTGVTESLVFNQDAVNQALYAAADAAGANSEALALMKLATGEMSEEQVQAALTAAALNAEILRQGENIANAKDPAAAVASAMESIQALEQELSANPIAIPIEFEDRGDKASDKIDKDLTPKVETLQGSIIDVASEFINMQTTATTELATVAEAVTDPYDRFVEFSDVVSTVKDNLFGLPEDIYIRIHYETYGSPPTDPSRNSGGNGPQGYATGGVVPGPIGRPQLAVVHGGEEVLTPSQRQERGRGNITISFAGAVFQGTSADTARQIVDTVAAKLGRL